MERERIRGLRPPTVQDVRRMWMNSKPRKCEYCRKKLDKGERTVDHAQPIARGGADSENNWRVACFACNQAKGMMTEAEFVAMRAKKRGGGM